MKAFLSVSFLVLCIALLIGVILVITGRIDLPHRIPISSDKNRSDTIVPDDGSQNANKITLVSEKGDEIYLSEPSLEKAVDCTTTIVGEAKGTWFFEGSFPIDLLDQNGKVVATFLAISEENWMTEEMVRFESEISCQKCQGQEYQLLFNKDNPSGIDENADSAEMSIQFSDSCQKKNSTTMTVRVYFSNISEDPDMLDCEVVYPTGRTIPTTQAVGWATLSELLKGPTSSEQDNGFVTQIPIGVKLNRLSITDSVAYVDFSNELKEGVGGSCRVAAIRSQIELTLKQFPTVETVVISIEGDTEDVLQP